MKRRGHTPEQIIRKLAEGEKLLVTDRSMAPYRAPPTNTGSPRRLSTVTAISPQAAMRIPRGRTADVPADGH